MWRSFSSVVLFFTLPQHRRLVVRQLPRGVGILPCVCTAKLTSPAIISRHAQYPSRAARHRNVLNVSSSYTPRLMPLKPTSLWCRMQTASLGLSLEHQPNVEYFDLAGEGTSQSEKGAVKIDAPRPLEETGRAGYGQGHAELAMTLHKINPFFNGKSTAVLFIYSQSFGEVLLVVTLALLISTPPTIGSPSEITTPEHYQQRTSRPVDGQSVVSTPPCSVVLMPC